MSELASVYFFVAIIIAIVISFASWLSTIRIKNNLYHVNLTARATKHNLKQYIKSMSSKQLIIYFINKQIIEIDREFSQSEERLRLNKSVDFDRAKQGLYKELINFSIGLPNTFVYAYKRFLVHGNVNDPHQKFTELQKYIDSFLGPVVLFEDSHTHQTNNDISNLLKQFSECPISTKPVFSNTTLHKPLPILFTETGPNDCFQGNKNDLK